MYIYQVHVHKHNLQLESYETQIILTCTAHSCVKSKTGTPHLCHSCRQLVKLSLCIQGGNSPSQNTWL